MKQKPSPPAPRPPQRMDEVSGRAPDPGVSLTLICGLRDIKAQDRVITAKAAEGWEFVESLMVYGNELLLRFRRIE